MFDVTNYSETFYMLQEKPHNSLCQSCSLIWRWRVWKSAWWRIHSYFKILNNSAEVSNCTIWNPLSYNSSQAINLINMVFGATATYKIPKDVVKAQDVFDDHVGAHW